MRNQPVLESLILPIRNQKVLLDADIAAIYDVSTKRLNEQVKHNASRFPEDFVYQLTAEEKQEVVANCDRLAVNTVIFNRLAEIDRSLLEHDQVLSVLWQKIQPLLEPHADAPVLPKTRIGFHHDETQ